MLLSYENTDNIKWIKIKIVNAYKLWFINLYLEDSKECFLPRILYLELNIMNGTNGTQKVSN